MTHKDITDENIAHSLVYGMAICGIRAANMPTQQEKALLISFIRRNFGGHTCGELKLAFDMAIAGKLNVDAICYENFSCEYVARIMDAYREWSKNEIGHLPKLEQDSRLKLTEKVDWSDVWKEAQIRAHNDDLDDYYIPSPVFDWLEKDNIIELTASDKWGWIEKARNVYLMDLRNGEYPDLPIIEKNDQIEWMTKGKIVDKKPLTWKNNQGIMSMLIVISKQMIVKHYAKKYAAGKI